MNMTNDLPIKEMKRFLIKSYVNSNIDLKRKYYSLEDEENSNFDEGWGIPCNLSMKEYELLSIFKNNKGQENISLELLKEKWKYEFFSKQ